MNPSTILRQKNDEGQPLCYPLTVAFDRPVDGTEVLDWLFQTKTGLPCTQGGVCVTWPGLYVGTADFWNVVQHWRTAAFSKLFGCRALAVDRCGGGWDVQVPYEVMPGRLQEKSDVTFFPSPDPFVRLQLLQVEPDLDAKEALEERLGRKVTAVMHKFLGVVQWYQDGQRRWAPTDFPENERDEYFPGWRRLFIALVDEMEGRDEGITVVRDPGVEKNGKARVNADKIKELFDTFDMVFIIGHCDAGKTYAVRQVIRQGEASVLFPVTRRAVADGLAAALNEPPVQHRFVNYLDQTKGWEFASRLVSSIDSLGRVPPSVVYQVVVLDEVPELLSQFLAKTVDEPSQIFERFCCHVKRCEKLVAMSADLGSFEVDMLRQMRGSGSVALYFLEAAKPKRFVCPFTDEADLEHVMLHLAGQEKRIGIPCAHKIKAKYLEELLKSKKISVMRVDADAGDDASTLLKNEDYMKGIQVLVYTQTIGSGFSLETFPVDIVICFFSATHSVDSQKQQMLRIRHNKLGLYLYHMDGGGKQSRPDFRSGQELKAAFLQGENLTCSSFESSPRPDDPTGLLDIWFRRLAKENYDFAYKQQAMLLHLVEYEGMEQIDYNEVFESGRMVFAEGLERLARLATHGREYMERNVTLLKTPIMYTEEELQYRQSKRQCTAEDKAALKAISLTRFMNKEVLVGQSIPLTDDAVCDLSDQDMRVRIRNLQNFMLDPKAAWNSRPGCVNRGLQVACLGYLLQVLGFQTILSAVLFPSMSILPDEVSQCLYDNARLFCHLAKLQFDTNLEKTLYPQRGISAFDWEGDTPREFDRLNPFFAKRCPAVAALVLVRHLIDQLFPKLKLERCDKETFVVYKHDELLIHENIVRLARGREVEPREFHQLVKDFRMYHKDIAGKVMNVCTLRLGPSDLVNSTLERIRQRVENKGDDKLMVGLRQVTADLVNEEKTEDSTLNGSVIFRRKREQEEKALAKAEEGKMRLNKVLGVA